MNTNDDWVDGLFGRGQDREREASIRAELEVAENRKYDELAQGFFNRLRDQHLIPAISNCNRRLGPEKAMEVHPEPRGIVVIKSSLPAGTLGVRFVKDAHRIECAYQFFNNNDLNSSVTNTVTLQVRTGRDDLYIENGGQIVPLDASAREILEPFLSRVL